AATNTFGRLYGGSIVDLDGKLEVTTVGSPAVGSSWPIISGVARSGTFASYDFGTAEYQVDYPPDGVTLVLLVPPVVDPAVTASGTPVTATEGRAFRGSVATFTDPDTTAAASEYSATIDWGDGSAVDTTPVISGGGGSFTVTGSHTYAEE